MKIKFDGVAPCIVTENGGTYIELRKRNPKFNIRTIRTEQPTVLIARISQKQATALGMLLIKNGR